MTDPPARVSAGIPLFEAPGTDVAAAMANLEGNVRAALRETGAALVRGFRPLSVREFADAAGAVIDAPTTDNGEHEPADPSGVVQTPVAFSPDHKLLWHNENSFNRRWPQVLVFSPTVVATTGGRTPIVDGRRMLDVLDPGIVARFRDRGITYVRRFGRGLGLPWPRVLGTESRATAEEQARREGAELTWSEGDTLVTRAVRPAVIDHPATGESVFFAQPSHWHPACLDGEIRQALIDVVGIDHLPRDCCFGDGSAIPDSMVREVLDAYASIERSFDWVAGDVLVVDNVLSAHARDPYTGPRHLLVAMGDDRQFAGPTGPETWPTTT